MNEKKNYLAFANDALFQELQIPYAVLGNDKLKTRLNNLQFISAAELSDRIRSDSFNGISACFFLTNCWSDNEQKNAMALLDEIKQKAIATVVVFCCENANEPLPNNPQGHTLIRVDVSPRSKDGSVVKPDNILRFDKDYSLLAALASLCASDPGAFYNNSIRSDGKDEPFCADLDILLHYDAINVAVNCLLLKRKELLIAKTNQINKVKEELEDAKEETLKICSQNYPAENMPESRSPDEVKSIDELCRTVCAEFETHDKALSHSVHSHVSFTQNSMAVIDDTVGSNKQSFAASFSIMEADPQSSAPNEDDLLIKTDQLKTERSFLRIAVRAAKELGEPGKPMFKSIMIAFSIALGAFIIVVGGVYLQQSLSAGWQNTDKKLLALLVGIPAAMLLVAAFAALISGFIRRAKIKHILKNLRNKIHVFIGNANAYLNNLKQYLNDFLSVFYNHHFRSRRIACIEKTIVRLTKEKERIMRGVEEITRIRETLSGAAKIAGESGLDVPGMDSLDKCSEWISSQKMPIESSSAFSHNIWTSPNVWIKRIDAKNPYSGGAE